MGQTGYVAALDIGSSRITLAVALTTGKGLGVRTYCGWVPSRGVEGGVISNRGDVLRCVHDLLGRMRDHVGFPIEHLHCIYSAGGEISCRMQVVETDCHTREDNDIHSTVVASQDVVALDQNCEKHCMASERLIDREALVYYANGRVINSSLEGTYASRFSCQYNLFFVASDGHTRLQRLLEQLPFRVLSQPLGVRGSMLASSTAEQRRQGIALLDVGGDHSQLTVYYNGQLQHYAWIGRGGNAITQDIVREHGLDYEAAEHSKVFEAKDLVGALDQLNEAGGSAPASVNLVVCAWLAELAEEVVSKLRAWKALPRLETNGLVLAGGGISFADVGVAFSKLMELAPSLKVRIGQPPSQVAIESISTDRLTTSDLMRMLPVIGVLQGELPHLLSELPKEEMSETVEAAGADRGEGEGTLRKGLRIVQSVFTSLMSDTE